MTYKEFKRLTRAQLVEIIYQLQLQVDQLTEQKQELEDALEDKRLRIRKACAILREIPRTGKLYILVGYTNKTTFYKHFREVTGMTPLEYKKETS